MIPQEWLRGEIAVAGLGKSGRSASLILARNGARVYASDVSSGDAVLRTANELQAVGVASDVGFHDLPRIARSVLLVASPGVSPDAPPVAAAREAGVPIVGEVEIALRMLSNTRYVAVTGTNGKTTTTALVGHLLRAMGYVALDAGNIGTPLCDVANLDVHPAWIALELSSFQLHDTPSLQPAVGLLTNLSADHLDRYHSVEEYYADKALLFRGAHAESKWVINMDDADSVRIAEGVSGVTHRFSIRRGQREADAWFDSESKELVVLGKPVVRRGDLALLGDHNVANALAAALAVVVADPLHDSSEMRARIADGIRTSRAMPHRLEPVGELDGAMWINDSKATNVSSTLMAVRSMSRPTVLLLGGKHKGEPYTSLVDDIAKGCKLVITYGAAAALVEKDLSGRIPLRRMGSDFGEVLAAARQAARSGDAVLLSPACSSYDMFNNFEERGDAFRQYVAIQGGHR
jgi:UDP-N-acetylmuramoylalanine--D-glutamate ligase